MRPSCGAEAAEKDILREADRILQESGLFPDRRRTKKRRGRGVLWFSLGTLFGAGMTLLGWLLVVLL